VIQKVEMIAHSVIKDHRGGLRSDAPDLVRLPGRMEMLASIFYLQ
jgi:hypothetical protein